MTKIQQIEEAIHSAEALDSKLTPECFEVGGFTSPKIRHLMNNLGAISTKYLECGTHRGALSVAANYRNSMASTLIDNWSEFAESDAKLDFLHNFNKFFVEPDKDAEFIENDCFKVDLAGKGFDLYLFDAAHDVWSQERAITHFIDAMADEFILVVDDFDWDPVKVGTAYGVDGSRDKIQVLHKQHLSGPDWHNGVGVFLIRKI